MVVSDNKLVFSNWEISCPMGSQNCLGYMFSSLFAQRKVAKRYIFTTALQKEPKLPFLGNIGSKN